MHLGVRSVHDCNLEHYLGAQVPPLFSSPNLGSHQHWQRTNPIYHPIILESVRSLHRALPASHLHSIQIPHHRRHSRQHHFQFCSCRCVLSEILSMMAVLMNFQRRPAVTHGAGDPDFAVLCETFEADFSAVFSAPSIVFCAAACNLVLFKGRGLQWTC